MSTKKRIITGLVLIIALILFIQLASAATQSNLNPGPGYEYAIGDVVAGSSQIYTMDVTSSDTYNILALLSSDANQVDISVSDAATGASITPSLKLPYVENGLKYTWLVSTRTPGKYSVIVHSTSGSGKFAFIHFYNSGAVYRPTTTVSSVQQDPIIGVWRFSDTISDTNYDFRYQFNADGTYVENILSVGVFYGTWTAQGGNSYILYETATGTTETIIYNPAQKSLYSPTFPTIIYTPYAGNAPSPVITTTVPTTVKTTVPIDSAGTKTYFHTWNIDFNPSRYGASSENAIAWKWDFGDGGASTLETPTHQYTSEGYWTVRLTVTYKDGSTKSFSKTMHTYTG